MEENPKGNVPPLSRGLDTAGDSGRRSSESTRSDSAESGVTVDSRRNRSCESCFNAGARLDDSSGWTDEKHNSYLDYLEASFVEQLNHSINLRCLKAQGRNWGSFPSLELAENSCDSVDQFAALRDGHWQRINFGKKRTFLDAADKSHGLKSPWIRCFVSPEKYDIGTPCFQVGNEKIKWVKCTGFSREQ